jgi:hypothetical protein
MVPIDLSAIDDRRERELGCIDQRTAWMMQPTINKGRKLGKRPISRAGTLNQHIIARSPGSRHPGMDFVKAVYSDRTGQE